MSLDRPVAVKMILSGEFASPDDVARFRLEAQAAANLDHPGIVPIYEIGEYGSALFRCGIAGASLAARLRHHLPSETADVLLSRDEIRATVRLVADVARAVHYAHHRGIIHRDLKPANILVQSQGHPHVTDFGLAKRMTANSQLTQTGAIISAQLHVAGAGRWRECRLSRPAADIYTVEAILA